jgi:hypothetical protein
VLHLRTVPSRGGIWDHLTYEACVWRHIATHAELVFVRRRLAKARYWEALWGGNWLQSLPLACLLAHPSTLTSSNIRRGCSAGRNSR